MCSSHYLISKGHEVSSNEMLSWNYSARYDCHLLFFIFIHLYYFLPCRLDCILAHARFFFCVLNSKSHGAKILRQIFHICWKILQIWTRCSKFVHPCTILALVFLTLSESVRVNLYQSVILGRSVSVWQFLSVSITVKQRTITQLSITKFQSFSIIQSVSVSQFQSIKHGHLVLLK